MKATVKWILARTALYMAVTGVASLGGVAFYELVHRHRGISHVAQLSASPLSRMLSFGAFLLVSGCFILIVLVPLAFFREKLSPITAKVILAVFLLIPVALIDLVGSTVPFILVALAIQICYVVIVRFNRISA